MKVVEGQDTDDSKITSSVEINTVQLPKNPDVSQDVWDAFGKHFGITFGWGGREA